MATKTWIKHTVGASSLLDSQERIKVLDGFHTPRIAVDTLLEVEDFQRDIWEPAAGFHRIAKPLQEAGHRVYTSDVYEWSQHTHAIRDFARYHQLPKPFRSNGCDVITNPPFKYAQLFAQQSLTLLPKGCKIALLMRTQFLEGNKRYSELFSKTPPKTIHVYSFRLPRMHRFGYKGSKGTSMLAFAWFIWQVGWKGNTRLKWIARPEQ